MIRLSSTFPRVTLSSVLLLLGALPAAAGITLQKTNPFLVEVLSGEKLDHPFIGGWHRVKPHFADIDADGDDDLFIVRQRPDDRVSYYRNDGTTQQPQFVLVEDRMEQITIRSWIDFVDIDGDGDLDIASDGPFGVQIHENVGTATSPEFVTTVPDYIDSLPDQEVVISSYPRFADLDADGDPDFLWIDPFSANGTPIYHENVGSPTAPKFAGPFSGWGNFNTLDVPDSKTRNRHGTSSLTIADVNGDSLPDIFIGDLNNRGVWFFENRSDSLEANFAVIAKNVLPDSTEQRNTTDIADIDGDGLFEVYVGPDDATGIGAFRAYEQTSPGAADYTLLDSVFIPCIDVGVESRASFHDMDDDGDLDLILGGGLPEFPFPPRYYENIGSKGAPEFREVALSETPFSILDPKLFSEGYLTFEFGDLDGDGDDDFLLGTYFDLFRYENTGSDAAPAYSLVGEIDPPELRVDNGYAPSLADLDADGDLDLLVGEQGLSFIPNLFLFRNDGGPESFDLAYISDNRDFDLLDVGLNGFDTEDRHFVPTTAELSGDSLPDLLIGYARGLLIYAENRGFGATPNMFDWKELEYADIDVGVDAAPALVDLDDDGDLDLVVGELGGGLNYFETISSRFKAERVASDTTRLSWHAGTDDDVSFRVYRSSAGSPDFVEVASGLAPDPSRMNVWYDTSVDPGVAYSYKLGATVGDTTIVGPDSILTELADFEFLGMQLVADDLFTTARWTLRNQRPDATFRLVRTQPEPAEFVITSSEDGFLYERVDETSIPGNQHRYELFVTIDDIETKIATDSIFLALPVLTLGPPVIEWLETGYLVSWTADPAYPGLTFDLVRIQGGDSTVVNSAPITAEEGAASFRDEDVDVSRAASYFAKPYYDAGGTRTAITSNLFSGSSTTSGSRSFSFERITPHPVQQTGQEVRIAFSLPRESSVEVEIYDITGRRVRSLRGSFSAGPARELFWDLENGNGETVSSGRYILKARVNGVEIDRTQSVIVLR